MTSIWTFFPFKKAGENFMPFSQQDIINKKVTQVIHGEKSDFNYSDFHDLKHNKYYDKFLAGELDTPSGQIVCTVSTRPIPSLRYENKDFMKQLNGGGIHPVLWE